MKDSTMGCSPHNLHGGLDALHFAYSGVGIELGYGEQLFAELLD
jgi:hypothetical protein